MKPSAPACAAAMALAPAVQAADDASAAGAARQRAFQDHIA